MTISFLGHTFLAIALLSVCCCGDAGSTKNNNEAKFRSIVGHIPDAGQAAVRFNCFGDIDCRFSAPPEQILEWLYRWNLSKDQFDVISYADFHAKLIETVSARKCIIPIAVTRDLFDGTETRLYHVRVTVNERTSSSWEVRIEVFQMNPRANQ